jgi:hypothetical protein
MHAVVEKQWLAAEKLCKVEQTASHVHRQQQKNMQQSDNHISATGFTAACTCSIWLA